MELRFAEERDVPAMMALVNRAFEVEQSFKKSDRLDAAAAQEYFRRGRFLLAEEAGALAGCVYVELYGERSYLGMLSVEPSQQRNGVGKRLVSAAEEFAREMGSRRMDLRVLSVRTELPPLYEKLGYRVTGTEPVPQEVAESIDQPCHFVRMTKMLGTAA